MSWAAYYLAKGFAVRAGALVWSSLFLRIKEEPAEMSDLVSPKEAESNLQTFNFTAKGNEGKCYEPTNANE